MTPALRAAALREPDLARLRRRDEAAFTELVELYHARLVRLARSFVRDAATAEEVAQEAWLAVVAGIDRFEGRGSLRSWLFSIVANRARTRAAREGRVVTFSSLAPEDLAVADAALFDARGYWKTDPAPWRALTPETIALSAELRQHLLDAIEALPPRLHAVLVLRDIEQVSSEDVCHFLEVSETNQRVLLHRARMQVRAAISPYLSHEESSPRC